MSTLFEFWVLTAFAALFVLLMFWLLTGQVLWLRALVIAMGVSAGVVIGRGLVRRRSQRSRRR
ncbi:MAG: hypothetical protein HY329_08025 [Chloroflexi bacterium]|nr:hypothetical protein [Chloroflexota bacterium]